MPITIAGRHCLVPENLFLYLNVMFNERTKKIQRVLFENNYKITVIIHKRNFAVSPHLSSVRGAEENGKQATVTSHC